MSESPGLESSLRKAWWSHWPYVKLSAAVFLFGMIAGVVLGLLEIDIFAILGLENLDDALPEEITTLTILVNNTLVFGLALLGLFSFGLLSVIILLFNGIVVGTVVVPAVQEAGFGFVILAIVPHGIFELPAFFVAAAVTFRLLHQFWHRIRGRRDRFLDPGDLRRIGLLLGVTWLVLAIAAIIEANLTVWLLEYVYPELAETGV